MAVQNWAGVATSVQWQKLKEAGVLVVADGNS